MKKVNICVESTQHAPDGAVDTLATTHQGQWDTTDGDFLLTYLEDDTTGLLGTTTTLRYKQNTLSLLRTGALHWEVCFSPTTPCHALYKTAYGNLDTVVTTEKVHCDIGETGGQILVDYTLEIQGGDPIKVIFKVDVALDTTLSR